MKSFSIKMQELRRVVKLHANWIVYATLGESALTPSEVSELKKYGKLPMGPPLDLVDKSYLLGRFRSLLKRNEYNNLNYEEITTVPLSPIEELVVEQARLRAGQALKGVAQEIADGTYSSLAQVLGKAVSEAVVSQAVADETALAVIHRKTAQELASNLAQRLQTTHRRNWKIVAETALQTAKVAGSAQAIVNKVGVYALSDGAESSVSVIPGRPACCADCTAHYVGPDGQPRVFKLSTLLGAGSNADGDVTHQKQAGRHPYWKTTLPPLHPSCGCSIVYVPPGHGWVDGKLSMMNKSLFMEHLIKARSGVSGGISPTVEPKGAPSNKSEEPKTPSMPGAAAPGNNPGPGRPSGGLPKPGSGTPGGSGGGPQYVACPFGGGADCSKHGGNGAAMHKPGGAIMKAHQEAMMHGAKPTTPEAIEAQQKQMDATAVAYNKEPHARDVVLTHLSEGVIGSAKDLSSEGLPGVHVKHKVTIVGNGSGIMKPAPSFPDPIFKGHGWADGAANMPKNSGHKSEVGASGLAYSLGLSDHIPPTVTRAGTGEHGTHTGPTSVQQWKDGYLPVSFGTEQTVATPGQAEASGERVNKLTTNSFLAMRNAAPDKDKFDQRMSEMAVMDIVMNNNDRHMGNLVANKDYSDVVGIDHGLSFASGMQGHKNGIHYGMESTGKPLIVSDHLMSRFKNSSLGSTERALEGSGLQTWQVMQTHLRQKYVSHLQETHGYIPPETTRYVLQGAGKHALVRPGAGFNDPDGTDDVMTRLDNFQKAKDKGQTPDLLFASFAKDYINKGLAKTDSPEHADFVKMANEMPLHQPGRVHEDDYHGSEDHKNYWDSIPAYKGVECESFEKRYNKQQPEVPKPLRTAPSMPAIGNSKTELATPSIDIATVKPAKKPIAEDVPTVKPAKKTVKKGLWIDPHSAFPLDNLDK